MTLGRIQLLLMKLLTFILFIVSIIHTPTSIVASESDHKNLSSKKQLPTFQRHYLNNGEDHNAQFTRMLCVNSSFSCNDIISCTENGALLRFGYCATFDENANILSTSVCPYPQSRGYNMTTDGKVRLPRNLSQLNDYMCAPLNRKGIVCSECADGWPFCDIL